MVLPRDWRFSFKCGLVSLLYALYIQLNETQNRAVFILNKVGQDSHMSAFKSLSGFFPSVCSGVVTKVVQAKIPHFYPSNQEGNTQGHYPVMLETTAAVHPGGSGGAVVNSDGHMIGLVTRYSD